MRGFFRFFFIVFFIFASIEPSLAADKIPKINLEVKEFKLANGMLFLVVERHATPQVACRLSIRAGSALEESGKTGIAHMLEHMMFKGTKNFGTTDPRKDQELQSQIEDAYQTILREQAGRDPDRALIQAKQAEMERLRGEVQKIYVPQAFSLQLSMNGASGINAFTSRDETQYFMSVPSDMMEQWFSIASEQLFEPAWREFYVEKQVVLREWAFRYINNPDGAAYLDLQSTAYTAHPYRNPTIGWKSDMERFNTTDAIAFHHRYYNPANSVCVLVGDITVAEARQLAETYFGRYPAGQRSPETVTQEPPQQGPRKSIRFLKGARAPRVLIGFHGAPMGSKDFYALDTITMILSQGLSGRMDQEIVNKGFATEAWAYNPDNRYAGMVVLGGIPNEPGPGDLKNERFKQDDESLAYLKSCEELERRLLDQVDRLKKQPVSPRELERVRKLSYRDFLDRLRTNEGLAGMMATTEVQVGWRYLLSYFDRISRVSAEEIMEAANKYLQETNRTIVFVVPGGKLEHPPEPYQEVRSFTGSAARLSYTPSDFANRSIYPTPTGWKHPLSFRRKPHKVTYEQAETANIEGANVFYLPDRQLPLVDLALIVKAGAVDVGESKQGLTGVFNGSLVQGGTENLPPLDLAFVLDEKAIKLSVKASEEETTVKLSVLKDDWEEGLKVLQEILVTPRFDDSILRVTKEQAVTALRRQREDARTVSMREAMIWHFQGHPYGRDPLRAVATIPALTKEDMKTFLNRYFVPSNSVVAVSGDIDRNKVMESLGRFFSVLPQKEAPQRNLKTPGPSQPVLAFIPKPGQVQSQVTLALPSVDRANPDYWKVNLLVNILGGNDSMLFTRLRENLGLVYATFFAQTYKWKAGMIIGYIGCKSDKTDRAILETVEIMKSLGRDIPDGEIKQKKMDLLNSFVFNVDTPSQLVEAYAHYYMRGEPLDTLERIQEAYMEAGKEELQRLARNFLDPGKLQIFVVGNGATVPSRSGEEGTGLEEALKALAGKLNLPYSELPLR